ncbi:MAG: TlyA family RNA methyltransferase [Desulfitobacteriaceae bacterium]
MTKGKERLDTLLVRMGLVGTREKAKGAIMAGTVYVNGQRTDKPGTEVGEDALLELKGEALPFVSRGGFKLAKAVVAFEISFRGKVVADIGASTGGFTDCALQNGAQRIYAVDVGYGQLAWKLRSDPRVMCLERTNARYLDEHSLPEKVDWVVSDVSFISITKIFPAMLKILQDEGQVLTLIKPQFEAGREHVGKKGVVKDPKVHLAVLHNVLTAAVEVGFSVKGLDYSPIRGPEGNIEYLAWLTCTGVGDDWPLLIPQVVAKAQKGTE